MAFFTKKRNVSAPPKDQPTLVKSTWKDRLTTGSFLFLAFFIPFIFMLTAFAIAKVTPFGDNVLFVTDFFHQYFPFLTDYHRKLQSGGSLLWTWASGGGTNYLGLMAYYLASPLNLLSVFFPAELLRDFMTFVTAIKIGLAGLFFALFLRITFKRRDVAITAFGIMYALCAFIMGYYWNIIWLDTVALLPLVVAGTFALLREGKFRLYIISLALAVTSNYYVGLFVCIFVVLVSVGYTIVEWKGWRKTLRDLFKMIGCSLVSILISAVMTLPAYLALKTTHSSNNTFPKAFAVNMGGTHDLGGVLTGIGKTISNTLSLVTPTKVDGLPNVYSGVFVIFLAILFLFCSKIKKRERFYCLGLVLFFMLSFCIRQLDYIWHGFHFPNQLPHRFSFLFSFVVIYMAFRVFMHIDSLKPISVIAAICGFIVYLGIAASYYGTGTEPSVSKLTALFSVSEGTDPDPVLLSGFFGLLMAAWLLLYTLRSQLNRMVQAICSGVIGIASMVFVIIFAKTFIAPLNQNKKNDDPTVFTIIIVVVLTMAVIAIFASLYSKKINADNQALRTMISVILIVLAVTEGMLSAAAGVNAVGTYDGRYYPLGTDNTLSLVELIKENEAETVDLYRTESNKYHSLNDSTLIGVNGISMFSSMVNRDITDYMEKFGICGWIESNRYTYQESSPFTNMMLNIKYLITHDTYLDETHMSFVASSGKVNLLKNEYYLPMGFMVKEELLDYDISTLPSTDPIANQNLFFRLATGIDADLYEIVEKDSDTGSKMTATAPYDGVAVAFCTATTKDHYTVKLTSTPPEDNTDPDSLSKKNSFSVYLKRPLITMIGNVKQGDALCCSCEGGQINGKFAMMNEELFQQAHDLFSLSTLQATEVSDTVIRGNIVAVEDGLFYTSIPAIKGWKAYVDNEEVEITPVGGAMVAFKLSEGAHIIELDYTPEGYPLCLIITCFGLLILIAMCILSWRKINLLDLSLARISTARGSRKEQNGAAKKPSGKKKKAPSAGVSPDSGADEPGSVPPTVDVSDEPILPAVDPYAVLEGKTLSEEIPDSPLDTDNTKA